MRARSARHGRTCRIGDSGAAVNASAPASAPSTKVQKARRETSIALHTQSQRKSTHACHLSVPAKVRQESARIRCLFSSCSKTTLEAAHRHCPFMRVRAALAALSEEAVALRTLERPNASIGVGTAVWGMGHTTVHHPTTPSFVTVVDRSAGYSRGLPAPDFVQQHFSK